MSSFPGAAGQGPVVRHSERRHRLPGSWPDVAGSECYDVYGAKSWGCKRRVSAGIEATALGLDIRCVITNLPTGTAEWLYDTLYCARGQAENLIKLHKGQLASDRTSCRSALANQVRLVLHTAAYWLMLTVRGAIPKPQPFATLRIRLIKIAGRIIETATRVRIAFTAACSEAELFRGTARSRSCHAGSCHRARCCPGRTYRPHGVGRHGGSKAEAPDTAPR